MERYESLAIFEKASGTLDERLASALAKLALAARHQLRQQAYRKGLSAVQAQVLSVLAREGPLEMSTLASRLGLTPATLSDSVAALEQRRLVRRRRVASDRRRLRAEATAIGKDMGSALCVWPELFQAGLGQLSRQEKEIFFRVLVRLILSLLEKGIVQQARMCVTCAYFRPGVHPDATRPHHCALADVPLSPATLRLDCLEHEPGPDPSAAMDKISVWMATPL